MPRIYASNNDPIDFCRKCFPVDEAVAVAAYGNKGDGPDGRGNCFEHDADHPDYNGEDYHCVRCQKRLTTKDNYTN